MSTTDERAFPHFPDDADLQVHHGPAKPAPLPVPPAPPPLSELQEDAVESVVDWLASWREHRERQVCRLFGYAGTGKTTIARAIARRVGGVAVFAAFTGKASSVLKKKGCEPVSTIHSLIYAPVDAVPMVDPLTGKPMLDAKGKVVYENEGKPTFELAGKNMAAATLVIIDECSMVNEELGTDLLGFGVPILVLGDPAQLPPVSGAGYFTNAEPDILLTEVHRQAQGSGIIQLATAVRQGNLRPARGRHGDDAEVLGLEQLCEIDPNSYDQVLVGRNSTRASWNKKMRARLGRTDRYPMPGEKLICLRNHKATKLLNGELLTCLTCVPGEVDAPLELTVRHDSGRVLKVKATKHCYDEVDGDPPWQGDAGLVTDFGYAITVHKSQGSQWDRVLLLDESRVFREHAARWLYTGITRAAKWLTVVR
jgi:exodeoxyribonuclease-5